ncbi:outer membrane beta-barrel protein [Solitalea lacus]|uniref:outer membrane beta-barrel protein n=1 Tax=Solitalea lacus TaxID=2911172 RepID=UPI001EDC89F3|nr:outer membrane beta-barrel protein [Solitalea lacus]UKJ08619.1 porin family protein [Solitalea lacus]
MKHLIYTLLIAVGMISIMASPCKAQQYYFGFSWNTALPMGSTSDYIGKYSVRGAGIEWGGFVKPQVSLGLNIGWNVFYEAKDRNTYNFEGGTAITGTPYNYINAIPIIAKAHYYFKEPKGEVMVPYLSLGLGTTWQKENTYFGINGFYRDGWMFGLFPELGLVYKINPLSGINFNVRYNYNFETDQVNELSYLGFNIGFVYRY